MEIDGHGALVTGGASGLGEATARFLAERGADVTILDLDGDAAAQVAGEIGGYSQQCDVSNAEHAALGVSAAMARFGQAPRIVVNCAGVAPTARIVGTQGKTSIPLFRKVVEVNLLGTYHVMSYAAQVMEDLPALEEGERGVIINLSSIAQSDGQAGQAAYAASKGAIASLCLPAAREFAEHGIRVMAIAGGPIDAQDNASPSGAGCAGAFADLVGDIVENRSINGTVIALSAAGRQA